MWFETLTGFVEESPEQVRGNITVDGTELTSHVNGKRLICGDLETPSLAELRKRVRSGTHNSGATSVREVVANVQHLHADLLSNLREAQQRWYRGGLQPNLGYTD